MREAQPLGSDSFLSNARAQQGLRPLFASFEKSQEAIVVVSLHWRRQGTPVGVGEGGYRALRPDVPHVNLAHFLCMLRSLSRISVRVSSPPRSLCATPDVLLRRPQTIVCVPLVA